MDIFVYWSLKVSLAQKLVFFFWKKGRHCQIVSGTSLELSYTKLLEKFKQWPVKRNFLGTVKAKRDLDNPQPSIKQERRLFFFFACVQFRD